MPTLRTAARSLTRKVLRALDLDFVQFLERTDRARTMHAWLALMADPRNSDPKRLLKYGRTIYSQNEEDGIIAEIFSRIGIEHKRFLEIGVGDGGENNTLALLLQGWTGGWIDGSPKDAERIRERFVSELRDARLRFVEGFVTTDSVAQLGERAGGWGELDLFSLDIDGNEYHILQALPLTARVVIVEYNAKFGPPTDWVMPYKADHAWDFSDYCGASLAALTRLMATKGYSLVGCNITGINAFFVRSDLAGERFATPYTAENHYEEPRYWMTPGFGGGYPLGDRVPSALDSHG